MRICNSLRLLRSAFIGVSLLLISPFALAQNAPPPPNAPPGILPPGAPPGVVAPPTGEDGMFAGLMEPYEYDPRGRRDPFAQPMEDKPVIQGSLHGPLLPLQKYDLTQLRLVGIIWDVRRPRAMLRDPQGKTHVVGPNTKVGPRNGYIATIREGEIVVIETTEQDGRLLSTAQVVKIAN